MADPSETRKGRTRRGGSTGRMDGRREEGGEGTGGNRRRRRVDKGRTPLLFPLLPSTSDPWIHKRVQAWERTCRLTVETHSVCIRRE
eukprot:scaffold219_cov394-Pavlova_lutheri.AAC.1